MADEPIELRLTISGHVYTWTGVADSADAMFALQLGRAISEVVLQHAERKDQR